MDTRLRLGLDFDNTMVDYDGLFYRCARDLGLVGPQVAPLKGEVREAIRRGPGNQAWIALQAEVYGRRILEAPATPGLWEFLERCRSQGVEVAIISHKTRRPAGDPSLDLHQAAAAWLRAHRVAERWGIPAQRWFFEPTRQAKLERIAREGCGHFVDDLVEVLAEAAFPPGVERLLYQPRGDGPLPPGVRRFRSWSEIGSYLFEGDGAGRPGR